MRRLQPNGGDCINMTAFNVFYLVMENQQPSKPLPLPVLIVGLIAVSAFAIWAGCRFFLYGDSIIYGVVAGVAVGAAYAFAKQIKLAYFS